MVSNNILSIATNVATKALLSPLCIIDYKIWVKYGLFITTNLFLNNCLSPHVANGDKVGHHWFIINSTINCFGHRSNILLLNCSHIVKYSHMKIRCINVTNIEAWLQISSKKFFCDLLLLVTWLVSFEQGRPYKISPWVSFHLWMVPLMCFVMQTKFKAD